MDQGTGIIQIASGDKFRIASVVTGGEATLFHHKDYSSFVMCPDRDMLLSGIMSMYMPDAKSAAYRDARTRKPALLDDCNVIVTAIRLRAQTLPGEWRAAVTFGQYETKVDFGAVVVYQPHRASLVDVVKDACFAYAMHYKASTEEFKLATTSHPFLAGLVSAKSEDNAEFSVDFTLDLSDDLGTFPLLRKVDGEVEFMVD